MARPNREEDDLSKMASNPAPSSDVARPGDAEKSFQEPPVAALDDSSSQDIEKQSLDARQAGAGDVADTQEVLGYTLDESDFLPPQESAEPQGALARTLSKVVSRASVTNPGPPPDGGKLAWSQGRSSYRPPRWAPGALLSVRYRVVRLTSSRSHRGAPDRHEHLGLHQLVRRLPDLLC